MSSIKKIKKYNPQKFIDDINRVSEVMVLAKKSWVYLSVTKRDVRREAEEKGGKRNANEQEWREASR